MEEKKKNSSVVIIVLLVIIILALGGYVVYDKVLNTNEKHVSAVDKKDKAEVKEEKVESLDAYDDLVMGLVSKITKAIGVTDYEDIYFRDSIFKASDFSNENVFNLALSSMYDEIRGDTNTGKGYKDFTAERLDKAIKSIVGSDYEFKHGTYISCPAWEYDANTKTYKAPESSGCGCTSGPHHTIAKTSKALKMGDKIEIYQRVIFVDSESGKGYSDSKKTKEITDLLRLGEMLENAIDGSDDKNISKGTLYKLTFEEEDGEYVFVSSEPVNQ